MNLTDTFSISESIFPPLISVNWHLWPRCIHRCKFCFGVFSEITSTLTRENALKIPSILKQAGTQKLSFTGGEPLLCPYLGKLIVEAKNLGLTTMLITSGTLLDERFISQYQPYIDWIALSIDSKYEGTQYKLGRGNGNHIQKIKEVASLVHKSQINLKINTVVTKLNWEEDMRDLIEKLNPLRWKVFQVLPIEGQNNETIYPLLISEEEFSYFVKKHQYLNPIAETNEAMKNSYLMLDSQGRFFQNNEGYLRYSESILETHPYIALKQVGWDYMKFFSRGGYYNWNYKEKEL